SGARSPTCWAIVHPLRLGKSLTSAPTYLPACSHGSARTKHGRSSPSSSPRFRGATAAPILAAAAAFGLLVVTDAGSKGGCVLSPRQPHPASLQVTSRTDAGVLGRPRPRVVGHPSSPPPGHHRTRWAASWTVVGEEDGSAPRLGVGKTS